MSNWSNPAELERLKVLVAEGYSSRQIAAILSREFPCFGGFTRNAVIGKVHRLGLRARPSAPTIRAYRPKPAPVAKPPKAPKLAKAKAEPRPKVEKVPKVRVHVGNGRTYPQPEPQPLPRVRMEDVSLAKPWLERAFGECAWVVANSGYEAMSCCHRVLPGKPYCESHFKRAYQKTRSPEQKAADAERAARMREANAGRPTINTRLLARKAVSA